MRVWTVIASLVASAAIAGGISLAQAQDFARVPATAAPQVLADSGNTLLFADAPSFSVPGKAVSRLRDVEVSAPLTSGISLSAAFDLDLQGRFSGFDAKGSRAFDGLFLSYADAPYAGVTSGGDFLGATIALTDDLQLGIGRSALDTRRAGYDMPVFSYLTAPRLTRDLVDLRTATTSMASLDWNIASWAGVGLTASDTAERHGVFGVASDSALASDTGTKALGMSAHVGLGNGWVTTVSYSEGITQLDLRPESLAASGDTVRSRSYGIAIAKHGLFADNDSLGLSVSRPAQVSSGGDLGLRLGTVFGGGGTLLPGAEHISLAGRTPETDFEMGYVTTFLDGALALQANAAWQQNIAGQSGVNSLAVLSRAKINF
ncbi:MAG: hypothetical protein JSR81_13295 [Proteobacteria bacterium]|nr:hypothetical protein [Pseudomonadota bacterium]